jgi:hypothetical protein
VVNAKFIGEFTVRTNTNQDRYMSEDYKHLSWEYGKVYLKDKNDKACQLYIFWESEDFAYIRSYNVIEIEFQENEPRDIILLRRQLLIKELID